MDIVGTRHIADVAAYLCGAGSDYAYHIADDLADEVIGDTINSDGDGAGAVTRSRCQRLARRARSSPWPI